MLNILNDLTRRHVFIVAVLTTAFSGSAFQLFSSSEEDRTDASPVSVNREKLVAEEPTGPKPYLVSTADKFGINSLECGPDPEIVFEQVLLWEIEYLAHYINHVHRAKDHLITKSNELEALRKECKEVHNFRK